MMKVNRWHRLKWTIVLLLFITTVIDATLPALLPSAFLGNGQVIISHITLYYLVTFAFYFRDSNILIYSFIFGLFYDSFNTSILGLYAASYYIIVDIVLRIKKYFPKNPYIFGMIFMVAITVLDFIVYLFYFEIGFTTVNINLFLVNRLAPTLIFNIILVIILYFPTRTLLRWLGYEDYLIF